MTVDYLVANSFMGVGKETDYDTPVVPGFWIPFMSPKWTPKVKWLPDTSMVGSPVVTRDLVPGVRFDSYAFKHNLYLDSIGNQLLGILGAADVVTGTGPYVHTFKLLNNAATGSQPPSYTIDYFDASQTRQIAGAKMASLDLAFGAEVACTATSTYIGNPETDIDVPSQTPSTAHFVPGWDMAIEIDSVPSTILVSGSLNIDRGTAGIFTSGQQGPHLVFSGPIKATGKAKFLIEAGATAFFSSVAVTRDQLPVVLTFTDPVSADTLALTMSACQFEDPVLDPGSKWLQVDVNFEAVSDTTDAVSGISPMAAVLTNSQSADY